MQPNDGQRYNTTDQLVNSEVRLVVNPDANGYAEGSLFLDQGKAQSELD